METIRTRLTRKRRRLFLAAWGGLLVFAAGMLGGITSKILIAVGLIGFLGMMVCYVLMLFYLRCPRCGENLGYALSWPTTWNLSIPARIKFCQFCGVSLDDKGG